MTLLSCKAVWAEKVPCFDRATLNVQYLSETFQPKFLRRNKWHEERHTVNEPIVDIQWEYWTITLMIPDTVMCYCKNCNKNDWVILLKALLQEMLDYLIFSGIFPYNLVPFQQCRYTKEWEFSFLYVPEPLISFDLNWAAFFFLSPSFC